MNKKKRARSVYRVIATVVKSSRTYEFENSVTYARKLQFSLAQRPITKKHPERRILLRMRIIDETSDATGNILSHQERSNGLFLLDESSIDELCDGLILAREYARGNIPSIE